MKFKVFLLLFVQISIVVSSKLPQSACKIVSKHFEKNSWMKTTALVKFENNFQAEMIDDLLQCLPASKILVDMKDFDLIVKQPRIHNPNMVIVIADQVDYVKLFELVKDLEEKPFLNHNLMFLILTLNGNQSKLVEIMDSLSITNYGILRDSNFTNYKDHSKKLLNNQTHKVVVIHTPPKLRVIEGAVHSTLVHYLEAVEKFENSKMEFVILDHKHLKRAKMVLHDLTLTRGYQIILNLFKKADQIGPGLMTYEETGYCELVPILRKFHSENVSTFLNNPHKKYITTLVLSIVIAYMILWRLGGHSTSVFLIPYMFWSHFCQQAFTIVTKKKIFVILFQILIFAIMFYSFFFQAIFTSLVIIEVETPTMTSLDELFMSEYTTWISKPIADFAREYPTFDKAAAEGRIILETDNIKPDNSVAVLLSCERAKYFAETSEVPNYIIDHVFRHYSRLRVSFLNKHLNRWQLIMDWCFEAGLPHAWETFERVEKYFKQSEEVDDTMLNLKHIFIACQPVFVGWIFSVLVLLGEIFWHDFVVLLYKRLMMMRQPIILKARKRNLRVRRVQVQPLNVEG